MIQINRSGLSLGTRLKCIGSQSTPRRMTATSNWPSLMRLANWRRCCIPAGAAPSAAGSIQKRYSALTWSRRIGARRGNSAERGPVVPGGPGCREAARLHQVSRDDPKQAVRARGRGCCLTRQVSFPLGGPVVSGGPRPSSTLCLLCRNTAEGFKLSGKGRRLTRCLGAISSTDAAHALRWRSHNYCRRCSAALTSINRVRF